MTKHSVDTLIIGGGPAGCGAAITLANAGVRALVCEAGSYPHSKVCGEFYSPECVSLLSTLGAAALLADHGAHPIEAVHLTACNGTHWKSALPAQGWALSRSIFDAGLASRALEVGAEVRDSTTVVNVQGNLAEGFVVGLHTQSGVTETVQARTVIAAYGKRSTLDRVWQREFFDRDHTFVAIKSHFNGPSLANSVELHAFPDGYCGLSEIERGYTNVSLIVKERTFRRVLRHNANNLGAFVTWMRQQNTALDHWFSQAAPGEAEWHGIGQVSFEPKELVVNDVLMAGDAARLVAPLIGDGISMALQSGILAARKCFDFLTLKLTAEELRRTYAAAWHTEFDKRVNLASVLQSLMLRPSLFGFAPGLFTAMPELGQQLILNSRAAHLPEVVA